MQDSESIVIIEWPEKIASILPKKRKKLVFNYVKDDIRNIIIG